MGILAASILSEGIDSFETGLDLGRKILEQFGACKPAVVLQYATILHDQQALLDGTRKAFGPTTLCIGCSTQGVVGRGVLVEEGYAAGALALGGPSLRKAVARQDDIHVDSRQKGAALGRSLLAGLSERPKLVIPFYDPLCGADVDLLLAGLFEEVRCPIIGAAASQPYSRPVQTFQYCDYQVFSRGAAAVALAGDFAVEAEICHGASPVGVEMTVTKVDGTKLLGLDGRPALDVWEELTSSGPSSPGYGASLAVGLPAGDVDGGPYLVRAAYGVDATCRGVIVPSAMPVGTRIMLHHRTIQGVLQGTEQMAKRLQGRLAGKKARAVLGFECGARTQPFLGGKATLEENLALQQTVPEGEWLGMLPWGEVYATTGRPVFHNYAYPVVVLAE